MELKRIPLHETHVSMGGKIVPFAGYEMPVRYSSDKDEHLAVRNNVGVFDVSHMGEFLVKGPNALELIQYVTSNDASKLADGQAQYSCFPNGEGGIIDDLIVYKFKEEDYMLVVNASNIIKDWNWIQKQNEKIGAIISNESDNICLFAVQGPKATDVLQKITDTDLSNVKFYHFTTGQVGGVENVIISGTGYTGAGGFELYVDKKDAKELWDAIFDAGKDQNIKPIGLGARDTLRLEMGFCLYGNDIDDNTSPIEAGLGWITKLNKDFISAETFRKHKEAGVAKKLIGFKMIDKGIPRKDYEIVDETELPIGRVTSGTMSPSLNHGIGMGYVDMGHHKPGTEIFIKIRGKKLKAQVEKPPFVK